MKIAHLADLHLGYRAYSRLDNAGFNLREKDVAVAFKEALDKIAEINPDLVLIAGDVFHRPRPSNHTIYMTIKLLQKFREKCSAPIVMISGNHETVKTTESGSVLNIPESAVSKLVVIHDTAKEVPLEELNTSVLCLPHAALADFENINIKPNKDFKYNILMLHGTYESLPGIIQGEGSLIKEKAINLPQWDYAAFGHYHKYTKLADNAFYSGATERTSNNIWMEAEDKKGFIVYDPDTKKHEFIALEKPRKVYDLKINDAQAMTGEEINTKIEQEMSKIADLETSIVRLTIENVDSVAIKELDYSKIREYKRKAVHFRLNLIKKGLQTANTNEKGQAGSKRKGIIEALEDELEVFELSQGIDVEKFKVMAREYLKNEIEAEG